MIILYVDDCILIFRTKAEAERLYDNIQQQGFITTDEGTMKQYLGMQIDRNTDSQPFLIDCIIAAVPSMLSARSSKTPATIGTTLTKDENGEPRVALSFDDRYVELFSQLHSSRNGLCRLSMRPVLSRTETKSRAGREKNRPLPPPRQVNKQSGHPVSTEQIPQHPHLRRCILRRGVEYELEQRTIVSVLPLRIRHFIVELSHHLVIQATIGNNSFRHRERICGILASASRRHSAHSSRS